MATLKVRSEVVPNSRPVKIDWIAESKDGKYLILPKATVKPRSGGDVGPIKLVVRYLSVGPYAVEHLYRVEEPSMPRLSEYPLEKDMVPGDVVLPDRRPSLCFPLSHVNVHDVPKPHVAELISCHQLKWGSSLDSRGEIQYLRGFREWTVDTCGLLRVNGLADLASAVGAARFDYHRPNGMYHALVEAWSPGRNTFITSEGEIGMSLWELREISGLSIQGEYYEEVVPSYTELMDRTTSGLPEICMYLFKAFSEIASSKNKDRLSHADWIDFWFKVKDPMPNPRASKQYQVATQVKYDRSGRCTKSPQIKRPFMMASQNSNFPFDSPAFPRLGCPTFSNFRDELRIAAYLALWLCRYVLPFNDDLRPGTFKAASKMAQGVTFSLVPPILACIYRGLSETGQLEGESRDLGRVKVAFPGHFLYAWAGLHFPRRVYDTMSKDLPRPLIQKIRGTLNAYQHWEDSATDCRSLLRDGLLSRDFSWNPMLVSINPGERADDGKRGKDTAEFMISLCPGYLTYRRNNTFISEYYNPHRFARQHGFLQRLPGNPKLTILPSRLESLYEAWLSLTRIGTGAKFHIPKFSSTIGLQVDLSYTNWWKSEVLPTLEKIPISVLLESEKPSFELSLVKAPPSLVKEKSLDPKKRPVTGALVAPAGKRIRLKPREQLLPEPNVQASSNKCSSSCRSIGNSLGMSPKSLNKVFPDVPESKHLLSEEDLVHGIETIGALDGLSDRPIEDNSNEKNEVEVVSNGQVIVSPCKAPTIDAVPMPPHLKGNSPIVPIVFCASSMPKESFTSMDLIKEIIYRGLINYLKKEGDAALQNGFSSLRDWWHCKRDEIPNLLTKCFFVDCSPLIEKMDSLLKGTEVYLSQRQEAMQSLDPEMNQRELASIEAESSIHTSRVVTFAEKIDSHVNIIKNANAQIEKLQQQVADSSTAIDMFREEIS